MYNVLSKNVENESKRVAKSYISEHTCLKCSNRFVVAFVVPKKEGTKTEQHPYIFFY